MLASSLPDVSPLMNLIQKDTPGTAAVGLLAVVSGSKSWGIRMCSALVSANLSVLGHRLKVIMVCLKRRNMSIWKSKRFVSSATHDPYLDA